MPEAWFPSLQPIGCSVEAVATMIGCLPTQAIAFGWKPGLTVIRIMHLRAREDTTISIIIIIIIIISCSSQQPVAILTYIS